MVRPSTVVLYLALSVSAWHDTDKYKGKTPEHGYNMCDIAKQLGPPNNKGGVKGPITTAVDGDHPPILDNGVVPLPKTAGTSTPPAPKSPPVTSPPVTTPSVKPVVKQPPVAQPPKTQAPVQPPVTQPPKTSPPATQPPVKKLKKEIKPAGSGVTGTGAATSGRGSVGHGGGNVTSPATGNSTEPGTKTSEAHHGTKKPKGNPGTSGTSSDDSSGHQSHRQHFHKGHRHKDDPSSATDGKRNAEPETPETPVTVPVKDAAPAPKKVCKKKKTAGVSSPETSSDNSAQDQSPVLDTNPDPNSGASGQIAAKTVASSTSTTPPPVKTTPSGLSLPEIPAVPELVTPSKHNNTGPLKHPKGKKKHHGHKSHDGKKNGTSTSDSSADNVDMLTPIPSSSLSKDPVLNDRPKHEIHNQPANGTTSSTPGKAPSYSKQHHLKHHHKNGTSTASEDDGDSGKGNSSGKKGTKGAQHSDPADPGTSSSSSDPSKRRRKRWFSA